MTNLALGLVETFGYIGAVEALDAALKSANVKLVGCEFVRGGIVTIKITGDVAAVKASIEAAEAAVNNLGNLINTHVIARVSDEVWKMLQEDFYVDRNKNHCEPIDNKKVKEKIEDIKKETDIGKKLDERKSIENSKSDMRKLTQEELETMKVSQLRTLARKLKITSMTKKQIKFGKKNELIEAILNFYERRGK
jgi:microcompartment protein CcmL/EutN